MHTSAFEDFHPIVNAVYFILILAFGMVILHPACLAVSLFCALSYAALLKGGKTLLRWARFLLPMMMAAAVLNPAFNHRGATILGYLPGGNPLTLESILYGAAAAVMLSAVLCWFLCSSAVMTSDKFICLTGRALPTLSLLLSMTLRFVPRLSRQLKVISDAQRCAGRDMKSGTFLRRVRNAARILSVLATWMLEDAVETADSMTSRGYGLPGRTAFSVFRMNGRDVWMLCAMLAAALYITAGVLGGGLRWRYFPSLKFSAADPYTASIVAVYFLLCAAPLILQKMEARSWKRSQLKI